jgi:hypothetical protein
MELWKRSGKWWEFDTFRYKRQWLGTKMVYSWCVQVSVWPTGYKLQLLLPWRPLYELSLSHGYR